MLTIMSSHDYCMCVLDRMDDRLIEVVGMYSSLHIGTIQVSLSEPLRIGQASEVKVTTLVVVSYYYHVLLTIPVIQ